LGTTECMSRVTPATIFDALLQTLAEARIYDAKLSVKQESYS
jgi:hypothetical protein